MPVITERSIIEGEYVRLTAGLTLDAPAKRVMKSAGTVRLAEKRGCCYGPARLLSLATGGRMECYLRPIKVAVSTIEYTALKTTAEENSKTIRGGRVTARSRISNPTKRKGHASYELEPGVNR